MTSWFAAVLRSPLLYLSTLLAGSLLYFSFANEFFGNVQNFKGIGAGAAVLGVAAIGVTLALAVGAIDFSVAGNIALTGVILGWVDQRAPIGIAVVAALTAALAVGFLNGLATTRFRVNPFIATLAMAGSLRGLAFVISGSSAGLLVEDGAVKTIGQKATAGLPNTLIVLLATAAIAFIALRYTRLGRKMLAVGGNAEAARLRGINVSRMQISGYMISAFGAGAAGILLAGRTGSGLPQAASGQELLIFSAVILGGTSLWGGRASVIGSLFGILFINVLYNGLTLQQISSFWQTILQGILLIVAVWLARQRQEGRDPIWLLRKLAGPSRRPAPP